MIKPDHVDTTAVACLFWFIRRNDFGSCKTAARSEPLHTLE
ncbi:hypothetical protein [Paracoccus liaowanqingii]|nr:hypothetical protein [Paracoccus liaowanqingii]